MRPRLIDLRGTMYKGFQMQRRLLVCLVVFTLLAAGCQTPPSIPIIRETGGVEPYQDVRKLNLQSADVRLNAELIKTLWFNETISWPEQYREVAHSILEKGMNPGLGVRKLHAQGITGKGVNIGIIDQNMCLDHPEYQGKIIKYHDVGTNQPADQGSMHGPAVTSLLVGEHIGTAPEASVYYVAAPSWTADAQYQADALHWLIDENEKLPENAKIRVVSVSAAPSGPGSPFTKNGAAWDAAYKRALEANILVLDCTANHGITAPCYYDLDDPDDVAKCKPGWPGMQAKAITGRIHIPTSFRTQAEEYNQGVYGYQYTGRGGLSWSVPYLAGIIALGWQVRPDLKSSQLLDILFETAYIGDEGAKIINPPSFIEAVKKAKSE